MKKKMSLSIRFQMIIGFVIPIIFIVLVGSVSYRQASKSLVTNYTNSSMNTLQMTITTLDISLKNVQNNLAELSQDSTVKAYALGGYIGQSSAETSARSTISNNLSVKQTATDMIHGIHLITVEDEQLITTQNLGSTGNESFINEMIQSEDAYLLENDGIVWGSSHQYLNDELKTTEDEYILFCSRAISSGNLRAVIVIDISSQKMQEILDELDFGKGSQVSFITQDGKEIRSGDITDIVGQKFFTDNKDVMDEKGFEDYVSYNGKQYYFMMKKCSVANGYVCAMVPAKTITSGSDNIRNITILLVLLACVVAVLISTFLISKISKNISKSVKRLDRVAQGELIHDSGDMNFEGNEFGKLQNAIYITVDRMRGLINTVKTMINDVSETGEQVSTSSQNVGVVVDEVNTKISQIHENIQNEDMEIASCNRLMEALSDNIKDVSSNICEITQAIEKSEEIIYGGMQAVNDMSKQSNDTSEATDAVVEQVLSLGGKMEEISHFVEVIESVAEETNLLSLNASIEAARAGENGRGFSVVAEEIRKLADNSSATAKTIQDVISEVRVYTEKAVEKAKAAEKIVLHQVGSVKNTEDAFAHINSFMAQLSSQMESLTNDVQEMNNKRHETVKAVKRIGELSEDAISSAEAVNKSLEQQTYFTDVLEQEADKLGENMKKLEEAIEYFKLI